MLNRIRGGVNQYAWVAVLLLCTWLAYGVLWQRGYYLDDYYFSQISLQEMLNDASEFRPLAHILIYGIFRFDEPIARVVTALLTLWLAFTAGRFAYRLTTSHVAMVFSVGMIAFPVFSTETTLWWSLIGYIVGPLWMVYALHLYLDVVTSPHQRIAKTIGAVVLFVLAFLSAEQTINTLILLPILTLIGLRQSQSPTPRAAVGYMFATGIITVLICAAIAATLYLFSSNSYVNLRGGSTEMDMGVLLQRAGSWLKTARNVSIGRYGRAGLSLGIIMSRNILTNNGLTLNLLIAAGVTAVGASALYSREKTSLPYGWGTWALLLLSLAVTCVSSLVIPAILVAGQGMAFRILFAPMFFVVWFFAALLAVIDHRLPLMKPVVMGLSLLAMIVASVILLGHADVFRRAHDLDQKQLVALEQYMPPEILPDKKFLMGPHALYANVIDFPHPWQRGRFYTVLQRRWASMPAVWQIYHTDMLNMSHEILNNSQIRAEPWTNGYRLFILGSTFPVHSHRLVIFSYDTYNESNVIYIYEAITLPTEDGGTQTIPLPLGTSLVEQGALSGGTLVLN